MAKITVLPLEEEYKPEFKCKKCGCELGIKVSLTEHKFGGPGIHAPTIRVCENCRNGDEFIF